MSEIKNSKSANNTFDTIEAIQQKYKGYFFSIRFKLISIISLIILVSLTLIISIATHYFKEDTELRIKENDQQTTFLLSNKIQAEYLAMAKNMKVLATGLRDKTTCDGDNLQKLFFENEKDVLFVGVYEIDDESLELVSHCLNPDVASSDFQKAEDFDTKAVSEYKNDFLSSGAKSSLLRNVSSHFNSQVILFSFPYTKTDSYQKIIISFIKMQNVAETFKGVNTNFMVDEKGIVLVHPDRDLVLAKKDLSTIPIVKNMMRSTFDNNQNRYKDEATGKYFLGTFKKLGFSGGAIVSIVPEEKVFAAVYALRFRNICLMIAVLCAAVAIVLVFSRTISIPILRLVKASKQIESGDFTTYVEPSSKDEVGMLTRSFNAMAKGLGEREKMKEAFGKFVNEELAEMAMKGTIKLGGERKYCAIFFSDIRSFTSISEKLQPEEVVEFLNQYMTEMVKCVKATGGTVDKFIGDAIMATWGALKPLKNETEAAINACIMMRKALIEFNKGRGGHKKPIIKIGCGVNSGYVISGQIGSNERLEYTVIGDAVNLASRIESLNKPFGSDILISEESYRKVKNIFKVEKMPSVKVKGKEDVQIVYAVLGRKDDPDCYKNMKDLREALQLEFDPNAFGEGKSKSKGKPGEEEKYEFI